MSLLALLSVWPQAFGAQRMPGIAQLIAFRVPLGAGLAALALIAGAIAMRIRAGRRLPAMMLASVLLLAALGDVVVLVSRGWTDSSTSVAGLPEGELTVMSWNTQGGATAPEAVAELVLEARADVVALPETDAAAAAEIVRLLAERGRVMVADTVGDSIPTSVLTAEHLGAYRLDEAAGSTPGLPSGVWMPDAADAPPIVVAHPMPPLPAHMADWNEGLDWIAGRCAALGSEVIVAGDLNATADHLWGLPECRDAAHEAGAAASGTWPSTAPGWLASPIDHVLIGTAWRAVDFRVIDIDDGSDHRPIVAVLARR